MPLIPNLVADNKANWPSGSCVLNFSHLGHGRKISSAENMDFGPNLVKFKSNLCHILIKFWPKFLKMAEIRPFQSGAKNFTNRESKPRPVVTTRVDTVGARGGRRREKDNEEQKNGQLNPSRGKKGRHEEQKNGQLDGDEVS